MFSARKREPGLGIHAGSCLSKSVMGVVRVGVKSRRVMSVVAPAGCTDVHARPFNPTIHDQRMHIQTIQPFRTPTFRDETQYAKLGPVADVDDRVDENLKKPIEHLRLLGALLSRADVVVRREDIFLENGRDGSTRLEHDTVEVIEIGIVVPIN
jgi:hypothetical protein